MKYINSIGNINEIKQLLISNLIMAAIKRTFQHSALMYQICIHFFAPNNSLQYRNKSSNKWIHGNVHVNV